MKYFLLLALMLTGCSAVPAPDVNYITETEATIESNNKQLELKGEALRSLVEIEEKRIEADKAIKIKKLDLAISKKKEGKGDTESPDISHCEEYRDEYPERFASCLEDKVNELSAGDDRQYGNIPSIIVSGDNNIVNIGSPGAEITHNGGGHQQNEEGNVTSALIKLIEKDSLTPLPEQPVQKHPIAQAIDATTGLAKELAYPVLYGVLGWKGFGALEAGIAKDSFRMDGNITKSSNNPVTTTTYPQAVTE